MINIYVKKIFLIALYLVLTILQLSGQYFVTKVKGRVKIAGGNYLKAGVRLMSSDKLIFSSSNDHVRVISPELGSFIFSPSANASKNNNEIIETLALCTRIQIDSRSLSGRSSIIEMVQEELNSSNKVVINNLNLYHFDVKKFPIENKNTFFIEIDVMGSKKIIKPLKTHLDTLLISYISLLYTNYNVDNTQPPAKYVLGFLRNGRSEKVASFTPYFDVANDMIAIINSVIASWADKKITIDSLRDICYSQVYHTIGKPNSISFFSAFEKSLAKKEYLENNDFDYYTGCDKDNNPATAIISSRVTSTRGQLPTVVTLKQYAPSVGNQGNTGTCTAWASAYAARSISYIYNNFSSNGNYTDSIQKYAFSPEYIYLGTRTNNTCNTGVTISSALKKMQTGGNVISDNQSNFNCSKLFSNSDTLNAVNYSIKDFQSLVNYTETYNILSECIIVKIKQHLAENKPIITAMHVPLSFNRIDKTGIWQPSQGESDSALVIKKCIENTRNGALCGYRGHAMCIIGYNDEINGGSFEIMNSWGNWWANEGFCWVSYKDFQAFGLDAYLINDNEYVPKKNLVLKGNIEFTEKCGENCLKQMAIDKIAGSGSLLRGQKIVEEAVLPLNTTLFEFRNSYTSGTRYRLKLTTKAPCYIYIFGYDGRTAYPLFPIVDSTIKESALIDYKEANLFIPAAGKSIMLDDNIGNENMCFIISKDSINVQAIIDSVQLHAKKETFYKVLDRILPQRMQTTNSVSSKDNFIEYDVIADDKSYLVFFANLKHI